MGGYHKPRHYRRNWQSYQHLHGDHAGAASIFEFSNDERALDRLPVLLAVANADATAGRTRSDRCVAAADRHADGWLYIEGRARAGAQRGLALRVAEHAGSGADTGWAEAAER